MKTVNFLIALFCLFALPFVANAQGDAPTGGDDNLNPNSCDAVIQKVSGELQAKADATCKTMKTTVQCIGNGTDHPVFVTLVIQPDPNKCSNAATIGGSQTDIPTSRGQAKPFLVDVLQEPCKNGGVTLTVYIPDTDIADMDKNFNYRWKKDGKVMDTDQRAECTSDKLTTLEVEHKVTGVTVTVDIAPDRSGR